MTNGLKYSRLLEKYTFYPQNIAADFLFVLCKENPDRLVKHTGYGNAAGLFAARGLLGGRKENTTIDYSSDDDDSETEEYAAIVDKVNPITGNTLLHISSLLLLQGFCFSCKPLKLKK